MMHRHFPHTFRGETSILIFHIKRREWTVLNFTQIFGDLLTAPKYLITTAVNHEGSLS